MIMELYLTVISLLACCLCSVDAWANSYKEKLQYECDKGKAIYKMKSEHDNGKEDRKFEFGCRDVGYEFATTSTWSGYTNGEKQIMHYQCPDNALVTGIYSEHNGNDHDRLFSFKCTKLSSAIPKACELSGFTNDYDKGQDVTLKDGFFMRGMTSFFDDKKNDRRFAIFSCKAGEIDSVATIYG